MEQSIERQPQWPHVLHEGAILYLELYQEDPIKIQQALGFIERAIQLDPKAVSYKQTKLHILRALNQSDQARQYKKTVQKIHPEWEE